MFTFPVCLFGSVAADTPIYETETTALLARFSGIYDSTRQDSVNALIKGLKDDELWSTLDVLQIYAAATDADALLNWKGTSYTASLVNTPTFTADRGVTTDGGGSYIDTGFNPSTGTNYTQDSANFGVYSRTSDALSGIDCGLSIIGYSLLNVRTPSDLAFNTINVPGGGDAVSGSTTDGRGLFLGNRTDATTVQIARNGSVFGSGSYSSTAREDGNMYVGCRNDTTGASNFIARQYAEFHAGAGWSSTQLANFYNRLNTYLTAIGAN